jgi:hypothetical protein
MQAYWYIGKWFVPMMIKGKPEDRNDVTHVGCGQTRLYDAVSCPQSF